MSAAANSSSLAPTPRLKVTVVGAAVVPAVLILSLLSRSLGLALKAVPAALVSTPPTRPDTVPVAAKFRLPRAVAPPLVVTDTPLKAPLVSAPMSLNVLVVFSVFSLPARKSTPLP